MSNHEYIRNLEAERDEWKRKYENEHALLREADEHFELVTEERDALAEAQQFPVSTVMAWKRRADGAEALMRYARLLLDPDRKDEPDEENALRRSEPDTLVRVVITSLRRGPLEPLLCHFHSSLTVQEAALAAALVLGFRPGSFTLSHDGEVEDRTRLIRSGVFELTEIGTVV